VYEKGKDGGKEIGRVLQCLCIVCERERERGREREIGREVRCTVCERKREWERGRKYETYEAKDGEGGEGRLFVTEGV
jgi:hypothetical protein